MWRYWHVSAEFLRLFRDPGLHHYNLTIHQREMALSAGTRLGSFEIVTLLGAGGMGEVYRARDTTLNRDVAVKVLPPVFASDADRLARFEREAQVLASLNHPNIAHIYGVANADGVRALVMEMVEGPTLADRIAQGSVPTDEAIAMACQIAQGLEGAHQHGIVHRDLKPANIKVRADGTVKVLDFGLAKSLGPDGHSPIASALANSPTVTSPAALTGAGVMLGTAAYMAPEQVRGKTADTRADIWALGCVLYEMLTGKRAFPGDNVSETLAGVLKSEPDWSALPTDTPRTAKRVLRRCLEKDPKRRFHHAADVRLDLNENEVAETAVPVPTRSKWQGLERLAWALITMSLAGVAGYALLRDEPAPPVIQFHVDPPPDTSFGTRGGTAPSFVSGTVSPDGTRLVFVATDASRRTMLWLRALDSMSAQPLQGTEDASLPFWSPDSRSIGFFAADKLKKIDLAGGAPQTICDAFGMARGGSWGKNGVVLFSSNRMPIISRVSAAGGLSAPVTTLDEERKDVGHFYPYFLPDGERFLYWVDTRLEGGRAVHIGSLATGGIRRLVASATNGLYAAPSWLLFVRQDAERSGVLLQQRLDLNRLELAGEPTPVVERLSVNGQFGLSAVSVSNTGTLTYRTDAPATTQFAWLDRTGRLLERVSQPGNYTRFALSPDEKRVAFSDAGGVWLLDLARGTSSRFTSDADRAMTPVWTSDGAKIVYRSGLGRVFEKDASGLGPARLVLTVEAPINGPSQVSPDGKFLLYFMAPPGEQTQDIFVSAMSGQEPPIPIVQTPFADSEPQLSPDGRWLAYMSDETGNREVYVQPFPPTGERWRVSTAGGRQPLWRPDGKELFFVNDEKKFYAAEIRATSGFDFGAPQFLFDMPAEVWNVRNSYVPSRDGQRFIVNTLIETATSSINVVVNRTTP